MHESGQYHCRCSDCMDERVGKTMTTEEMLEHYDVLGFMAPFVVVRRKSDGKKGSLEFQHSPRLYFHFVED